MYRRREKERIQYPRHKIGRSGFDRKSQQNRLGDPLPISSLMQRLLISAARDVFGEFFYVPMRNSTHAAPQNVRRKAYSVTRNPTAVTVLDPGGSSDCIR